MKHRDKFTMIAVLGLLLAFMLPVAADQPEKKNKALAVQPESDREVQDLRAEITQLEEKLRDRRRSQAANVEEWQEIYEEKASEIRRRQEFENRYLADGE